MEAVHSGRKCVHRPARIPTICTESRTRRDTSSTSEDAAPLHRTLFVLEPRCTDGHGVGPSCCFEIDPRRSWHSWSRHWQAMRTLSARDELMQHATCRRASGFRLGGSVDWNNTSSRQGTGSFPDWCRSVGRRRRAASGRQQRSSALWTRKCRSAPRIVR